MTKIESHVSGPRLGLILLCLVSSVSVGAAKPQSKTETAVVVQPPSSTAKSVLKVLEAEQPGSTPLLEVEGAEEAESLNAKGFEPWKSAESSLESE